MEYLTIALVWLARMVIMAVICTFLGFLGIRILDALTPKIEEREKIGEDSIATGLFIAGFIIFIGIRSDICNRCFVCSGISCGTKEII